MYNTIFCGGYQFEKLRSAREREHRKIVFKNVHEALTWIIYVWIFISTVLIERNKKKTNIHIHPDFVDFPFAGSRLAA